MKVPIWRVLRASWRDVWRAFGAMPKMALILFAISCANAFAFLLELQRADWSGAVVPFTITFAMTALYAPVLIALHRYVLLGEVAGRYEFDLRSRRFHHYFFYSVVFVVLGAIPIFADLLVEEIAYAAALSITGMGILVTALVWATLIFPAIAVDATNAGWAAAFRDLRGNFWRALGICAAIVAPAFAIMIPLLALDPALRESVLETPTVEPSEIGIRTVLVWLVWGAIYALMTALWVVAISHLYRMLANSLRQNPA